MGRQDVAMIFGYFEQCLGIGKVSLAIGTHLCILEGNCRWGGDGDGRKKSGGFGEAAMM